MPARTKSAKPAPQAKPAAQSRPAGGLRVALAQIAPLLGNQQRNFELHHEQIAAARQQNADLVIFPELSLTGYYLRDMVPEVAMSRKSNEIWQLIDAAGPAALVAGFVEESRDHLFYNAALFAEQGRLLHVHRKVYLPTYGLFEEQRFFAAGRRIKAFDSDRFGRVGLIICEDFWHVSTVAIMQAEGVDLLIVVVNSPARGVDSAKVRTAETYELFATAYAQLIGAMVIVVNRVGFEDGLCFWGASMVFGPDGRKIVQAPQFEPSLTITTIHLDELRRERLITPLARDEQLLLTIEELNRIKRRRYED